MLFNDINSYLEEINLLHEQNDELHALARLEYQADRNKANIQLSECTRNYEPNKLKILLVGNNPTVQEINRIFLEFLGCNVDITTESQQAIIRFQNYDLLLLDTDLTNINGIEMCQKIREKENNSHIPIIVLVRCPENFFPSSTEESPDFADPFESGMGKNLFDGVLAEYDSDVTELICRTVGANDFVIKPVFLDKMEQLIKPWFRREESC